MRLNYYRFPEEAPEDVRLKEGCAIVLKSGGTIYAEEIPDDKRELVDYVDDTIGGISVTRAKQLLKQYGGVAWTEHCDRSGSIFETSSIEIGKNNSKFKYNTHL